MATSNNVGTPPPQILILIINLLLYMCHIHTQLKPLSYAVWTISAMSFLCILSHLMTPYL